MAVKITITNAGSSIGDTLYIYENYSGSWTLITEAPLGVAKSILLSTGFTFTPNALSNAYQVRDVSCGTILPLNCAVAPTTTSTTTAISPTTTSSTTAIPIPTYPPTVITGSLTSLIPPVPPITTSGANIGGQVVSDGGSPVTVRGMVWGTSTGPVYYPASLYKTTDGTGTGIFSSTLTNLNPSLVYYARAYAVNAMGVSYGAELSFNSMFELLSTSKTGGYTGVNAAVNACADPYYLDQLWATVHPIINGSIIYNTNVITDPFNGGNKYYAVRYSGDTNSYTIQISPTGVVSNTATCVPLGAVGSVNMIINGTAPVHTKIIGDVVWNSISTNFTPQLYTDAGYPHNATGILVSNDIGGIHTFGVPVTGTMGPNEYVEFVDSLANISSLPYTGPGTYNFAGKTLSTNGSWRVNFYTNLTPIYTLKTLTLRAGNGSLDVAIAIENTMPYDIDPIFTVLVNGLRSGSITFHVPQGTSNVYTGIITLTGTVSVPNPFTITEASDVVITNNTKTLNYNDTSVYLSTFGPYFTVNEYPVTNPSTPGATCGSPSAILVYSLDRLTLGKYYPKYDAITGAITSVYGIYAVTTDTGGSVLFDAIGTGFLSCTLAAQSAPF